MRRMAIFIFVSFVTAAASSQTSKSWPAACGPQPSEFRVKTEKNQSAPAPQAGTATIVFIESTVGDFPGAPTARFAVDGNWLGADRGRSFISFSVPSGEHHLCAARQSGVRSEAETVGLAILSAEVGKVYYFEFKIQRSEIGDVTMNAGASLPGQYPGSMTAKPKPTIDSVEFSQLSTEQGQTHLQKLPMSVSSLK